MPKAVPKNPVLQNPSLPLAKAVLEVLNNVKAPPAVGSPAPTPANQFQVCSPPSTRTAPQYQVSLRRPVPFAPVEVSTGQPFRIGCVEVNLPAGVDSDFAQWQFAVDLRFTQTWNLVDLSIGDMSSTMSLAPGEQVTLEFQTSMRRVLDQTKEDSAEEMTSSESTTFDKEVINVMRTSSNTQHWYVDGQGSYSQGKFEGSVKAGYSQTLTDETKSTIDHTTETTKKSAHSLKTLHKIIVHGTTETFVQNRMTRIIKNPYLDRTLSVNVFQLLKHFSVETALTELRPILLIRIDGLTFDPDFVQANQDFLRNTLLEQSLVEDLPAAVRGARGPGNLQQAINIAKEALLYLYGSPDNTPTVFNLPLNKVGNWTPSVPLDPNDPANSLNANLATLGPGNAGEIRIDHTGLKESMVHHCSVMFTILNYMYRVYLDYWRSGQLDDNAILIAQAIASSSTDNWTKFVADPLNRSDVEALFDNNQYVEIFRRVPGFLAMVSGMLSPLIEDSDANLTQRRRDDLAALARLTNHLRCYGSYYTQQFLEYIGDKTKNDAIVDFVKQLVDAIGSLQVQALINSFFDPERSFIDKQTITVPGVLALQDSDVKRLSSVVSGRGTPSDFSSKDIPTAVVDLEVPCDGIHLEVAQGACVLQNVPATPTSVEVNVQGASLKATAP